MPAADVLIIGGGPAACSATIRCRQHGLSTMMVAANDPVYASAESIHPGLQTLLKGLGADADPASYALGTYTGIEVNGRFQPLSTQPGEVWEGSHIDKQVFCSQFRQAALEQGVPIKKGPVSTLLLEDGRVTGLVCATGEELRAGYTIDCSGRSQVAGRSLKLKKKYYSPPLVAWSGACTGTGSDLKTAFITAADHWNWLSPEKNGRCSWTRLARTGWTDFSQPQVLSYHPMEAPADVWNVRWRAFRPLVAKGLVICGDAAGIIDPASSQGILSAAYSGIMAANCVREIFVQPAAENLWLSQYDQWFIEQFESKVARLKTYYQELMPEWYASNWLPGLF
jgi:flavin-dependent dehydrogenase